MKAGLLVLSLLVGAAGCRDARPLLDGPLVVLHDVTVIDGPGGPPRPGQTVVLRGDRILALGDAGAHRYGIGVEVVDGAGRYVLPGFIDTHAHITILPPGPGGRLAER